MEEKILITVDLERYESLISDEARLSVLRQACVRALEGNQEKRKISTTPSLYKVEDTSINVKEVLDIIGASCTFNGFKEREEQ